MPARTTRSATTGTGSSTPSPGATMPARSASATRPVHLHPLSNEVQSFPPAERVY